MRQLKPASVSTSNRHARTLRRLFGFLFYGRALSAQPPAFDPAAIDDFIASVSKSFTSLAVMQLVEDGKVDLDAPVRTYLPEFTLAERGAASRITIRHLLTHTSGLSEPGFPDMRLPQPDTILERVISLRAARPVSGAGAETTISAPTTECWRMWWRWQAGGRSRNTWRTGCSRRCR